MFAHRTEISALAVKRRLPAVSMFVEFAEAGGLMAYGPSLRETFRRCGAYVDRILQGAKPGELPVERPEKFELVINRKPAKALGLMIPPSLLQAGGSGDRVAPCLSRFAALDAFLQEHRRCGELDGGVEGERGEDELRVRSQAFAISRIGGRLHTPQRGYDASGRQ